jgi:hypothetical protein
VSVKTFRKSNKQPINTLRARVFLLVNLKDKIMKMFNENNVAETKATFEEAITKKKNTPTGPMSERAKYEVSKNALKTGLSSKRFIIYGENKKEYEQYRDNFIDILKPINQIHVDICFHIILTGWNIKRVSKARNGAYNLETKLALENSYNIDNDHIPNNNILESINKCTTDMELYNIMKQPLYSNINLNKKNHNKYIQLPNLLIYGPSGSGKKTLIKLLLEDIYNKQINDVKKVKYQITGYGNSNAEVEVEQSNYHIIIEPSNSGLDKYLIHEIVKEYAQQTILKVNDCTMPFRIVLINNIDNLSYR